MLIWVLGPKSIERASVLHQPDGVGSQRQHIVPIEELNGVSITLAARSGVISKTFGELLEEIHVTWDQFGNKWDKIATLHKVVSRMRVQCRETAAQFLAASSELTSDGVKNHVTTSDVLSVWMSPGYGVLDFVSSWKFVKCRHIYTVSSLMDTAYRMSESVSSYFFV
ncbi:hypothetical protein Tco_0954266 [Tanacetum coccineum]|uniref:Uncharacterized protein n=1 Tax=Tanacetum coccineum TaxID=301880 RepID=A0ABQ5E298_9ASTR